MQTWKDFPGWMRNIPNVGEECKTPLDTAKALLQGLPVQIEIAEEMGEGFEAVPCDGIVRLKGGERGLLYGAYRCLFHAKAEIPLPKGVCAPAYPLRMINAWDNMSGTVERGYAGRSMWFEGNSFSYDRERIRQLGHMLASVGINCLCVNNVNVFPPAQELIDDFLPELASMAALLRPYGVRVMTSVDFSMPLSKGLDTADPLDEEVSRWWKERADLIYSIIPDFAGFLVKADSEHRPGPFTYGRTHAEGANMLAAALAPHGGWLVWRAFVYNCLQDWRDQETDRPMAAYATYAPLDGQFAGNVILQVKNGPFDFQVREPVSPLFYGMEHTNLALEVQLAQEYTGQQIDLYFMPPMWREFFDACDKRRVMACAAVSNLGRDDTWCGHPLAMANLFSYGLFSWDPDTRAEDAAACFVRLAYGSMEDEEQKQLCSILLASRRIYEKYTSPLGLCWMVRPNGHYGPDPDGYEYQPWGTYHRANRDAVGIDRTETGTGYVNQYPDEIRRIYADKATCPELLLLFFHRLRYDEVMADGRTVVQRVYDDHFEGVKEAEEMAEALLKLDFPEAEEAVIADKMEQQLKNAKEWRDVVNSFFYRFSGMPDAHGRKIWL